MKRLIKFYLPVYREPVDGGNWHKDKMNFILELIFPAYSRKDGKSVIFLSGKSHAFKKGGTA
jgi:hypothetical protein